MSRIRFVPLVLLLTALTLLAACTGGAAQTNDDLPPEDRDEEAPLPGSDHDPSAVARPPEASIEIGGGTYPLGVGSYCWSGPSEGQDDRIAVCADALGITTAFPYAEATPGATMTLAGPLTDIDFTVATVQLWPAPAEPAAAGDDWEAWTPEWEAERELAAAGNAVDLPADLEPGRYLLAISITGDDSNSATYGAVVEVN